MASVLCLVNFFKCVTIFYKLTNVICSPVERLTLSMALNFNNTFKFMKMNKKFATKLAMASILAVSLSACQSPKMGQMDGKEYSITIKNGLAKEKFAPILIVSDADDNRIWVGNYVSSEAHTQFTTGNPQPLARTLGGDQDVPGKLLPNGEVTFKFKTRAKTARITAMVHPDFTPDNYVTAKINLEKGSVTKIKRYDIGDNENRKTVEFVSDAGTVTVE